MRALGRMVPLQGSCRQGLEDTFDAAFNRLRDQAWYQMMPVFYTSHMSFADHLCLHLEDLP